MTRPVSIIKKLVRQPSSGTCGTPCPARDTEKVLVLRITRCPDRRLIKQDPRSFGSDSVRHCRSSFYYTTDEKRIPGIDQCLSRGQGRAWEIQERTSCSVRELSLVIPQQGGHAVLLHERSGCFEGGICTQCRMLFVHSFRAGT